MPKVSVVVPIYNVENYLDKCINSIINQSLKDIEIILVDDGSTDNSLKIIEDFKKRDNRIKVIQKKNGGQGSARNEGIKIASGEYIGFVDADDYIDLDMYEKLYKEANGKLDICVCSRKSINDEGKELIKIKAESIKNKAFNISEYVEGYLMQSHTLIVCNKIYDKNLLIDNRITFKEFNEIGSEDTLFNLEVLRNCKNIGVVSETYYNQISRTGSTTRKYNAGYMIRLGNLLKTLKSKGFENTILYIIYIHFNDRYISLIKGYGNNPKINFIEEIKNNKLSNIYYYINKKLIFDKETNKILKNRGYSIKGIIFYKAKLFLKWVRAYKLLCILEGV
nr:glycosyltransferase [Clostridium chrysemydis]